MSYFAIRFIFLIKSENLMQKIEIGEVILVVKVIENTKDKFSKAKRKKK